METIRILVVDDETGIREGCRRALRNFVVRLPYLEEDYAVTVDTAASGEEALDILTRERYDLMLLDNKLPGITGVEVLERITRGENDIVTIMITAFASLETAVTATKNGAYDFLTKPFTPEELRSSIHKAAKHLILTKITQKLSEEKRKVRFQFLSVLSHELKAPIAAVSGYLQLLRDRTAGDDLSAYGDIVGRALDRMDGMQKLIYDLLDLTRIESGEKKRELAMIRPADVARRCLESLETEAQRRTVTVTLDADTFPMRADAAELEIIFNNLLSNAIKYNRPGGTVTLTISRDGNRAVIAVADTGIGIAPEDAERLFKEFSRIRNRQTAAVTGSGLGLSIVKKLALLYNGEVTLESVPGAGSTFRVTLDGVPDNR